MDNLAREVVLHIDENLDGLKSLNSSYSNEGFSLNISDDEDIQIASRLTYDVTSSEYTSDTLNGVDATDDYLAIPFVYCKKRLCQTTAEITKKGKNYEKQ